MNELIITPLGTVSPNCYKDLNCPGYLVENNSYKVLLDCGNGISRLLELPNDFENLIIVISHLHKDHYGDILSLGYASYIARNLGYLKNRIKVYIPKPDIIDGRLTYYDVYGHINYYAEKIALPDYQFLMNFGNEHFLEFITYDNKTGLVHGDMKLSFRNNPHQINTYSTKIETDNHTIVYSGDTGFQNNSLETFAKDANLLICESTFLKGQTRIGNNHLYAYEAGTIATRANVDKLLLNHFYPYIDKELYVKEATEEFKNTEAAIEGKKMILRR